MFNRWKKQDVGDYRLIEFEKKAIIFKKRMDEVDDVLNRGDIKEVAEFTHVTVLMWSYLTKKMQILAAVGCDICKLAEITRENFDVAPFKILLRFDL